MERVGGAFESITGAGGNTNQSQSRSSIATGTQAQQQPSSTNTNTDTTTDTNEAGILGTLSDKLRSVTGAGGEGQSENAETQGCVESENPTTVTDPLNVSQAKDEQIGEFIRHQNRSSTGDVAEEEK